MSKVKKQHYVPQFYLKRFTYDGERLFVFDKIAQKQRVANVKDIAHENYFYDIPIDSLHEEVEVNNFDVQVVEKALGGIEGKYSQTIKEVLENLEPTNGLKRLLNFLKFRGGRIITKKQKRELSFFITIQFLRTKESRDATAEMSKKFTEVIFNAFTENNFPEIPADLHPQVEIDKNDTKLFHLQNLFNPEYVNSITKVLNNHIWILGINKSKQSLYTSDHPVVKNGSIKSPFRSFEGLGSKGIEIAIPLTPNHILLIYEKTFFNELKNLDRKIIDLNEDNVIYYNSLQVLQSYRQIYCSANDFNLVKDMCQENPNLGKSKKDRITVS